MKPHRDCRPWTVKYQLKIKTTATSSLKYTLQKWNSVSVTGEMMFEIIIMMKTKN